MLTGVPCIGRDTMLWMVSMVKPLLRRARIHAEVSINLHKCWIRIYKFLNLIHQITMQKTSDEIAMATSYGMMAVEESTQLFCAASFGQGVEATAQKALNAINGFDDLEIFMTTHCGLDHAAMLGGAIASVMKGIPMIMEGTSGKFTKMLLERASGKTFPNLVLTSDLNMNVVQSLPGHRMISTAIILKTLWSGSAKTDCGKVKQAA